MQYFPAQLALANLKGEIDPESRGFLTKERALERLREETGQDFGADIARWEAYVADMYKHVPQIAIRAPSAGPDWLDHLVHRRSQGSSEKD
jgi:hypothetical protein